MQIGMHIQRIILRNDTMNVWNNTLTGPWACGSDFKYAIS